MRSPRLITLLAALTACSSGSAPTSTSMDSGNADSGNATADGGTAAEAACAQEAEARCTQMQTCEPIWLQVKYGNLTTCESRYELSCNSGQDAPQTGQSAQLAQSCATAIAALSCADFLAGTTPMDCEAPVGNLTPQTTCLADGQCNTQFCGIATNAQCGTCQAEPMAGSPCEYTSCGEALTCGTTTNTCLAPGASAAACDDTHPCGTGLDCVGSTTTRQGACEALGNAVGSTCDATKATAPGCDERLGLFCLAKACAMGSTAAPGGNCGVVSKTLMQCTGGATCKLPTGQTMGICQAPAPDGSACDPVNGPGCLTPARCVQGTGTTASGSGGVCTLPNPASCSPS